MRRITSWLFSFAVLAGLVSAAESADRDVRALRQHHQLGAAPDHDLAAAPRPQP